MTAVPFSNTHFHSIATLRDKHATTFHSFPLCDTRRESATILHSDSVSLTATSALFLLLLSISLWIQLCQALCCVSVYLRVHLSRSHSSERDAIVMNALVIQAMRGDHPPVPDFEDYTWNTHRDTLHIAYDGKFWGRDTFFNEILLPVIYIDGIF